MTDKHEGVPENLGTKLITSRITLEQLVDEAPVLIWVSDITGERGYFSKQWYRYTGQKSENTAGRGWMEVIHPDDRLAAVNTFHLAANDRTQGKHVYRLRSSAGEYRWMLDRATPQYDEQGTFIGHIGCITDIHNRKTLEEQSKENERRYEESALGFRKLVEKLPLGVCYVDVEGRLTFMNEEMLRIWGNVDTTTLRWSGAYKLYDPNGKELLPQDYPVRKAFLENRSLVEEATVETPDGERKHVICYPQPLYDSAGVIAGVMNFIVDITDRKVSEAKLETLMRELEDRVNKRTIELEQANEDLIRANNDLEQYAYIASHDLQEPLRKIRFFADLLSRRLGDPESFRVYLSKIEASASRMSTLIHDVLNYSTLLKNKPTFVDVDLNDIADEVLSSFADEIANKKARVTVAPLPTIQGVSSQFLLLFHNLLGNALTFSEDSPTVEITAQEVNGRDKFELGADPNRRYVQIDFKDHGIGFNHSYGDKIFEVFERLHNKGSHTGNGMGLSLSKKIIENHRGFIVARSTEGVGSTFEIYLPLHDSHPA